jgi:Na+-translocating ferredoxin:NAD+ oxidoreductase subunit D
MERLLVVSPSPHIKSEFSTQKLMLGVILALMPTLAASIYYFGFGAIIVTLISVITCVGFEYLLQKYLLKKEPTITDGSAILTGLLLAFNLPSNLPILIIIIGAMVAIGIGKISFGGLGQNPFNPALVGRVFLLISFPVQMTTWPVPSGFNSSYLDAVTGATPLAIVKEAVKSGQSISSISSSLPSHMQMFYGYMGGSMGEICAFALLIGLGFMLYKRIITWHIPVSVIGTVFIFSGIFYLINPEKYMDPLFHVLTGGVLLGAIFMATDYVTSPMTKTGMVIFGVGIGLLTITIRNFGAYPEGISFAILIMNAFVPLINRGFKPKLFGKEENNG